MADRPTGFPGKTARLNREGGGGGGRDDDDPGASGSSIEMVISEDMGKMIAGRYEITEAIGEGGMGVVYEAYDTQVERNVAIKLVRAECAADRKFITRFRRELEVTSHLRHPSTIRVFEHGENDDGRPYMVMELLTGESLADRMERGRIKEIEALQYARQIAESLSEAHENGIFHRDLKPDNIFIETVGVSTVVKVLDFGIAGGVDATRLTQAGEVFGTPQYMSPEQCNGITLDHRTDIYSLGCILYEMIEGKPPFSAESPMATMLKHVRSKVPPPRHCSKDTAKVIYQSLRKDRGKRIQSAADFAELIGQAIGATRARQEGRAYDEPSGLRRLPGPTTGARPATVRGTGSAPIAIGQVTPEEGNAKTVVMVLGGAFLLLIGLVVFGDLGGGVGDEVTKPTQQPGMSAVDGNEADGEAEPVNDNLPMNRADVRANVEGADVLVDGEKQCESPCQIKVPVGDGKPHEIKLQKPGYTDVVTNWQPRTVTDRLPELPDMKPL